MDKPRNESLENLLKNRQSFYRFNEFKISRTLKFFSPIRRHVFNIVPRLLHVHQEGLPGYVEGDVPCGIHNFNLNKEIQVSSETLFPNTVIRRPQVLKPFIRTVLIMGSMGTIAQNLLSDLDYTILISKKDASPEQLELFKKKLALIEQWVWKIHGIETHFFINDEDEVRNNVFGESDSESTGSALAKLLKEEIYRTGIIISGKVPFWMVVPVETDDAKYQNLYNSVQSGRTLLDPAEFIDIGNVDDISRGEFFGGSIWTLIKSFKSPFKTLIKMGLLENYMFNKTKSNLLCHEVKKRVFENGPSLYIDPYIILFERVERFFQTAKSENEVDALRTGFYLKIGTKVTPEELERGASDPLKNLLVRKIKLWNWTPAKVDQLNNYLNWQMMQKVNLGARVNKILMNSYKLISEHNKTLSQEESLITEKDTHLLGRKLFSFYRKVPHKVENLFVFVDGKNSEQALTFLHQQDNPKDKGDWYLIRGKNLSYIEQIHPEDIIKKSNSLEFLVAFASFNRLYDKNTRVLLRAENQSFREYDLHIMLHQISQFMAPINIASIANQDLLREAHIKQVYFIVDFGNPIPRDILIGNIQECKTDQEVRNFIHKRLERVIGMTSVYLTSWGELFCKNFRGIQSFKKCTWDLIPNVSQQNLGHPDFLRVYIPSSRKKEIHLHWLNQVIYKTLQSKR